MRILLVYDNFIRDYRGFLLLSAFLKKMGHKVWIYPGWKDPLEFAELHQIQVMVVGQIGEAATEKFGRYCNEKKVHLVINTSEPIVAISNYKMLLTYNTYFHNQDIISLQTVGIQNFNDYINNSSEIREENRKKYKFIGFPRIDLAYHTDLRNIETRHLENKYKIRQYSKVYLFVSSFLFDDAFKGVPEKDLKRWNYDLFKKRTENLKQHTVAILRRFVKEYLGDNELLLIKKHPWDCSSFWNNFSVAENCRILDNTEFITGCINVCDVMIHTYSTSAIEAWILGKKTVAIFLEEYTNDNIVHMQFENIAYNYSSFIKYLKCSHTPNVNNKVLFNGKMDGKATYRLAYEINLLKPKKEVKISLNPKVIRRRLLSLKKNWDIDTGNFFYDVDNLAEKNTKYHDFLNWENQRSTINKLYRKSIQIFVNNFKKKYLQ